jgi:hypothetical protein
VSQASIRQIRSLIGEAPYAQIAYERDRRETMAADPNIEDNGCACSVSCSQDVNGLGRFVPDWLGFCARGLGAVS